MLRLPRGCGFHFATMTAFCALAGAAAAQDMPPLAQSDAPAPQAAAPAQQAAADPQATAPAPGPATPAAHPLNKGQLEQIVAPIALYPDPLLSQVLMASTYPLEIVEAERWIREPANRGLKGDALTAALKEQNWDPSVKALIPFPKLLELLAQKVEWTEQLGNAFLAQQADVMNAVQALRHNAMNAGNLKATPQCHCVIQTSGDVISIMPSDNQQVCVPVYNPRVAYGTWPEPDYPPYYFPVPVGFAYDPGYVIGYWPLIALADFGPFWGWSSIDWGGHSINVDRARYAAVTSTAAFSGSTWVHDPAHRGGVGYRDPAVTSRFGAARTAAITSAAQASGRGATARGAVAGAVAAGTTAAAMRAASGRGTSAATTGRFAGGTGGRFGGRAAAGAGGRFGGGHVASAHFAAPHAASAHFGGGHFAGGRGGGGGGFAHAHFGGGGGGAMHMGGGGFGGHGGGGGGGHGGGGGGGHGGGGGGGHGGGHH